MKILGIDPGLRKTGWGVVVWEKNSFSYLDDGFFLQNDKLELGQKLLRIFDCLSLLIKKSRPDLIGIEQTFVGSGNISSLKLGMARGICILTAAKLGIKILEIQPKLVKKNITGSGIASKDQVNQMVKKILNVVPRSEDSSDALAVAMSIQSKYIGKLDNGKYSSNLEQAITNALEKEKINIRK
ncbi:crossover junction endodeoxyribonuclease RuvC [Alphaproteobacteria bacterium]|nr:crossover junction endodeoxyribonuclease RuvC [Alphaproteobacteria bacterium]